MSASQHRRRNYEHMYVYFMYTDLMGYRGKVAEQARARELRRQAWTLDEIAAELHVAKSSVSLWVRDVDFEPRPRMKARRRGPNILQRRKAAEIEDLKVEGLLRLGSLSDQAFLAAGAALYAGEGAKRDGEIRFANTNPHMVRFFCVWLRHFFQIDESRLTVRVYLHQGLDLDAAQHFWSELTAIPLTQFRTAYRAEPDPSVRRTKHMYGCVYVRYSSTSIHRAIMGLIDALLSSSVPSGVAQSAERRAVNAMVESSSLSPGAQSLFGKLEAYSSSR
jgi:hypothetical protein